MLIPNWSFSCAPCLVLPLQRDLRLPMTCAIIAQWSPSYEGHSRWTDVPERRISEMTEKERDLADFSQASPDFPKPHCPILQLWYTVWTAALLYTHLKVLQHGLKSWECLNKWDICAADLLLWRDVEIRDRPKMQLKKGRQISVCNDLEKTAVKLTWDKEAFSLLLSRIPKLWGRPSFFTQFFSNDGFLNCQEQRETRLSGCTVLSSLMPRRFPGWESKCGLPFCRAGFRDLGIV